MYLGLSQQSPISSDQDGAALGTSTLVDDYLLTAEFSICSSLPESPVTGSKYTHTLLVRILFGISQLMI